MRKSLTVLAGVAIAVVAIVAPTTGAADRAKAEASIVAPVAAPVAVVQKVDTHFAAEAASRRVWLAGELSAAHVALPSNVIVIFTDTDNCGSQLGPDNTGGGCTVRLSDGTISVLVSPTAVEDGTGGHILFHELGHALHNMGECEAEYFSHLYSDVDMWSYPQCIK